ncbi:hypothetical protein COV06_02875 [Candidatus Uhrbacteria bacterium CG10_big_fil_rev_8_21_14_0_10_50_16]|uniref:Protein kinase domain-containing protein n=1 Tax=Candidatus Uhrbacteria bacterium CG10_big_fil_rev_8_21_14_0_10_50_16 TaxID=1975039 RepID=A0A2H0RM23_9BACT|nr:MAG: hypothetical protein COV06_02875 [Candidatus Uhrbacteria bacterium CG10_big_fil_rev_8_21_14_0_10_50_16]
MSETWQFIPPSEGEGAQKQGVHAVGSVEDLRGNPIGEGGNSRVFEVKGHPDQVLLRVVTGFFKKTPENLSKRVAEGNAVKQRMAALPQDVHVAKILKAFVEGTDYYELQERAVGKPLHDRNEHAEQWLERLKLLANAPLDQYERMIHDLNTLTDVGLEVDPSKPDNIFYDADAGFTYIDLQIPSRAAIAYTPFVQLVYGYSPAAQFTEEANTAIRMIEQKLREAGDNPEQSRSSFDAIQSWMEKKKGTSDEVIVPLSQPLASEDEIW